MYTIRIINGDSAPFEIITNHDGLFHILSLINMNSLTFFKVFMSGVQVMPSHFGWDDFRGWVTKFPNETPT